MLGTVGVLELAAARGHIDLGVQIAALKSTNYQIDESMLNNVLERFVNRTHNQPPALDNRDA